MPASRPSIASPHTDRAEGSVSFAEFPDLVARLTAWSRRQGMRVPGIQSPPRAPGVDRAVRRVGGEVRTIAVTLRGRRRSDVVNDLVSGILVANGVPREGWTALLDDAARSVEVAARPALAYAA